MPVHAHLAILAGMSKLSKTLLVTTFLLLLAGCGAKGPLVLPDRAEPEPAAEDQPADDAVDQASDPAADQPVASPEDQSAEDPAKDVPQLPAAND